MRISVVTPSLNQGSWIEDCLRSVRESGPAIEHLVIDGGSIDATRGILEKQTFAAWISEPDAGQSDAINKGLARCTGDILGYLCADDFLEPGALEAVRRAFRDHPEIDVVHGDAYFLESDSGWKRRKASGIFSYPRLRRKNFLLQPAVFWRRAVYERFGGFDAGLRYCMDHEYWLRIGATTRWYYLEEPLATCRLHADAKTSRALSAAWWEAAAMQARFGIRVKPQWDALWMTIVGQHYYRLKRRGFAAAGRWLSGRTQ